MADSTGEYNHLNKSVISSKRNLSTFTARTLCDTNCLTNSVNLTFSYKKEHMAVLSRFYHRLSLISSIIFLLVQDFKSAETFLGRAKVI